MSSTAKNANAKSKAITKRSAPTEKSSRFKIPKLALPPAAPAGAKQKRSWANIHSASARGQAAAATSTMSRDEYLESWMNRGKDMLLNNANIKLKAAITALAQRFDLEVDHIENQERINTTPLVMPGSTCITVDGAISLKGENARKQVIVKQEEVQLFFSTGEEPTAREDEKSVTKNTKL